MAEVEPFPWEIYNIHGYRGKGHRSADRGFGNVGGLRHEFRFFPDPESESLREEAKAQGIPACVLSKIGKSRLGIPTHPITRMVETVADVFLDFGQLRNVPTTAEPMTPHPFPMGNEFLRDSLTWEVLGRVKEGKNLLVVGDVSRVVPVSPFDYPVQTWVEILHVGVPTDPQPLQEDLWKDLQEILRRVSEAVGVELLSVPSQPFLPWESGNFYCIEANETYVGDVGIPQDPLGALWTIRLCIDRLVVAVGHVTMARDLWAPMGIQTRDPPVYLHDVTFWVPSQWDENLWWKALWQSCGDALKEVTLLEEWTPPPTHHSHGKTSRSYRLAYSATFALSPSAAATRQFQLRDAIQLIGGELR